MTSIVFDFADIRSRMLGDDKPKPKTRAHTLLTMESVERPPVLFGVDPARPGSEQMIFCTSLPCGTWRTWRRLNDERSPHQRLLSPHEIVEAAMLKLREMRDE